MQKLCFNSSEALNSSTVHEALQEVLGIQENGGQNSQRARSRVVTLKSLRSRVDVSKKLHRRHRKFFDKKTIGNRAEDAGEKFWPPLFDTIKNFAPPP